MKNTFTKTILVSLILMQINIQSFAQKDTTEFEIGKKKLIVIDKKIQKENAIFNLEKGKETFEQEIADANKKIAEQEALLVETEASLQILKDSMAMNASFREGADNNTYILNTKKKDTIKGNFDDNLKRGYNKIDKMTEEQKKSYFEREKQILENQRIEFENQKAEIANIKATIEVNKKKKVAFESGIKEINKGIEEIENGLAYIDDELENISSDGKYKTSFDKKLRKKRFNAHWAGFEFGLLNFVNNNQQIVSDNEISFMEVVPEKTFSYGLNIFELNVPFTKYSFGFATGAGLRWSSLNLEKNVNLVEDENGIIIGELMEGNKEVSKNKLNVTYIRVPLVLEYQTPIKTRKLYVGLGLFGEIRAWSKQRQKYEINGVTFKDKIVDDFQLSPFTYGVSARAGYGDIGVFVEYTLVPLFKDGQGPEMYPVMVGLRVVDF